MKKFIAYLSICLVGMAVGGKLVSDVCEGLLKERDKKIYRQNGYYNILVRWVRRKIEQEDLESWFIKHNYKNIAIYGIGELGKLFFRDIEGASINVNALIDKGVVKSCFGMAVQSPEENLDIDADVIIVTATFAFDAIKKSLLDKGIDIPVVSLEDVIFDLK